MTHMPSRYEIAASNNCFVISQSGDFRWRAHSVSVHVRLPLLNTASALHFDERRTAFSSGTMLGLIGQFVGLHGGTDSIVRGGQLKVGQLVLEYDPETRLFWIVKLIVTTWIQVLPRCPFWLPLYFLYESDAVQPLCPVAISMLQTQFFPVSPLMAQINKDSFVEVKTSVEPKKALFLYSSVQYWLAHRSSRPWLCSLQYAVVCLLWRNDILFESV